MSSGCTFSFETLALLENRARFKGVANVVGSILVGLAAAVLGWVTGLALR
jgi:fluoride ion exporter CrcB/FEX